MLARAIFNLLRRVQDRHPVFVVNTAAGAAPVHVNIVSLVNNADIRTEMYNGREHLVIPSYTLPDNVIMNGGMYPKEEIETSYKSLENTPAPVGHPMLDGQYVSAYHPAAINAYYAGAYNRNVERRGNRVYVEKWVDKEFASTNPRGQELLAAVNEGKPIHTSTGVLLEQDFAANGEGYKWTARNMRFDHDAILINEIGAATPEQGVGLMVNTADAVPVLSPDTYETRRAQLADAVRDKYESGEKWVYVEDFDATTLVYCLGDDYFSTTYSVTPAGVVLGATSEKVERKTTFSTVVNKILTLLRGGVTSEPAITPNTAEAFDMTPEELKAFLDAQDEKAKASMAEVVNAALAPIKQELASVTAANAELSAQLKANTSQAEAEKKAAVAAEFGDLVANSLTGEALDTMFAKCAKAAPLLPGFAPNSRAAKDGFDDTLPEA